MTAQAVAEPTADDTSATVEVRVESLIVGRALTNPVYDSDGVLLLAAGAEMNSRFFELLRQHKVTHLRIHQQDLAKVTLLPEAVSPAKSHVPIDSFMTQKLDALIDSGALFVANSGPSLRDNLVMHGCRAYDPDQRESLIQQHQATGESLDNMMREAMRGHQVDHSQIAGISAVYLTQLTQDCDNVLTVASEAGKDNELAAHCLQLSLLGMAIGIEMGLDERNIRNIGMCGLVHDWGMTTVPSDIRNAERILTKNEFLEVQKHPIRSLELLEKVPGIPTVVPLVCYQVHESMNGKGYPRGRRGNSIHLFARILKVADAYVAMSTYRPYRPRIMPYAAMEILIRKAKTKDFDPAVVRALLHVVSLFPIGSLCTLSDGSVARVLRSNREQYTRPVVQRLQDAQGQSIGGDAPDAIIDLRESEISICQALPEPGVDQVGLSAEILDPVRF